MTWSHEAHRIYGLQRTKWTLAVASIVKVRKTLVEQKQEASKDLGPLSSHLTTAMLELTEVQAQ